MAGEALYALAAGHRLAQSAIISAGGVAALQGTSQPPAHGEVRCSKAQRLTVRAPALCVHGCIQAALDWHGAGSTAGQAASMALHELLADAEVSALTPRWWCGRWLAGAI